MLLSLASALSSNCAAGGNKTMKKLLIASIAVLALTAPAFAQSSFSLTGRFETTYSTTLAPSLTAGVLGRLDVDLTPSFGVGVLVRPFIQYSADLVSNGALSVSGYARVRVPITIDLVPSAGFGLAISPQAGLDATYDVGSGLSLLAGVRALANVSLVPNDVPFSFGVDGYLEADYVIGAITAYAGISLDSLLPSFAFSLYLGGLYDILPNLTFNPELGWDLGSNATLLLRFNYKL